MTTSTADDLPEAVTAPVERSPDADAAAARFLDALADWVDACVATYRDAPPTQVHDQLTYTVPWATLIRHRGHDPALQFLRAQRDRVHAAHRENGLWHHGYWRQQEVHHGTEHFELFLAMLWRLAPADDATARDFLDMAEHLGNFASDVPAWFDYDTSLFRSMHLGTEWVGDSDATMPNIPDHFRCVNLALLAHAISGETKFHDLAARHARRWADAMRQSDAIPQAVGPDGAIEQLDDEARAAYGSFAGQAGDLSRRVDRAENLLCSDAPTTFLRLWQATGERAFRDAARRVLDELATQLHDPDAGAAADALRRYRRMTGETRYDTALREAVAPLAPDHVRQLTLSAAKKDKRPSGVGKRGDMPSWLEDGEPARHHPITLAAAAEVCGDDALMTAALDLARTRFELARRLFNDGRKHGCSARSVSAVARGHGRENNAGMVTAVLDAHLSPDRLADGGPARAA